MIKNYKEEIYGDKVILRQIQEDDIEEYYIAGFSFEDKEINRLTGTKVKVTKELIEEYVKRISKDENRYDFLILDKDRNIIGESVINEFDEDINAANFRIVIFKSENLGKGFGSEAIKLTIKFAFEKVNLNRLQLDVFDFNERAQKAYKKAGFILEGRLRDVEIIDNKYCDVLIMSILKRDYFSNILKND